MRRASVSILIAMLFTGTARADLVVNLRYDDGTTFKDVAGMQAGDTLTINVWATIRGQPGNSAPEGISFLVYSILSHEQTLGQFNGGGITGRALQAPFNNSPVSEGLINDANADGVNDLGSLPNAPLLNQVNASVGASLPGPGSGFGHAIPDGWEFLVQRVTCTLNTNDITRSQKQTDFDPILPAPGSFTAGWLEDGQVKNNVTSTYVSGTSVSVFTSFVPEPGFFGIGFGAGLLLLRAARDRQR